MSELNVDPLPAPWQSMTTTLGRACGFGAADGGVDLTRVEAAAFVVHRVAACDLSSIHHSGDYLHVKDDEDRHRDRADHRAAPVRALELF